MSPDMKEKIERGRKALYLAVKNNRPDLYQRAVQIASVAQINGNLKLDLAAEIESACMDLAAVAAGITVPLPH